MSVRKSPSRISELVYVCFLLKFILLNYPPQKFALIYLLVFYEFGYGLENTYVNTLFEIDFFKTKCTGDMVYVLSGSITLFDHFGKMWTSILRMMCVKESGHIHTCLKEIHLL